MTDDELTAIEARANAATAGPWETHDPHDACCGGCCTVDGCHESHPCGEVRVEGPAWNYDTADCRLESEADAAFIASARTDVPKLVGEVKRLCTDRDSAAAALAELQRTVATAVECLRADGSAGNVERVCGWLDVVKGDSE